MKDFLSRKGVKFSEYNVANDTTARDQMVRKTGRLAVPTIIVGSEVVVGYNPAELERLLH